MYRAVVVEDEPLVSVELSGMLRDSGLGIEVAASFANAEDAFAFLGQEAVDLVLLDIGLPGKSGLDLLAQLRLSAGDASMAVVIVSANADGRLIREAFRLGVQDYLIKSEIDLRKFTTLVGAVLSRLGDRPQSAAIPHDTAANRHERQLAVNVFFNSSGMPAQLPVTMKTWQRELEQTQQTMVGIVAGYDAEQDKQRSLSQMYVRWVEELFRNEFKEAYLSLRDPYRVHILVVSDLSEKSRVHQSVRLLLDRIKQWSTQYIAVKLSFFVGQVVSGLDQWQTQLDLLQKLESLPFYDGFGLTYFPEDLRRFHSRASPSEGTYDVVIAKIQNGDPGWKYDQKRWLDTQKTMGTLEIAQAKQPYQKFLYELASVLNRQGLSWEDAGVRDPLSGFNRDNLSREGVETLLTRACEALYRVADRGARTAADNPSHVRRVLEIIARDYGRTLSLEDISAEIGLSTAHMCRVFAKETGSTLHNHLTKYRIEKAKELLESGLKAYEVGSLVGFENPSHFNKVFKKNTGMTVLEYRKRLAP